MWLPRSPVPEVATAPSPTSIHETSRRREWTPRPPPPRPALLVVEDDLEIAGMMSEVLSEYYEVDHAADAERGLDLCLHRHYDALVVDRRLPGMDGWSLRSGEPGSTRPSSC